jgi:hypothetical protein
MEGGGTAALIVCIMPFKYKQYLHYAPPLAPRNGPSFARVMTATMPNKNHLFCTSSRKDFIVNKILTL